MQVEEKNYSNTENLKYCKTYAELKEILTDLTTKNKFVMGNFFIIQKDSSTNFIMKRAQFSHLISEP
jgi:hypothetical protein